MASVVFRWLKEHLWPLLGGAVFVVLAFWWLAPRLTPYGPPVLRMSAGPDQTRRHKVAAYLAQEAQRHQLTIELADCAGSEDCLQQVKQGTLDVALVSSGVVIPDDEVILVLGAAQLEAVHVLVRKELAQARPLSSALRGKRVNLGVKGSTEWLLSHEFLKFARLRLPSQTDPGDVIPTEYSRTELLQMAQAISEAKGEQKAALLAALPDCVLLLATMPSQTVQALVEAADYQIAPLPATRAFLLDNMQDSHASVTVLEREFLEPTVISRHSYFAGRTFPEEDCETVGVRLLVVAHRRVPAEAITPLMQTIFEGEFARRNLPQSPRELATPYAIHPAAVAYLDRQKPLASSDIVEWFSDGLSIFGAFAAGALSLYGLLQRKKMRKPADYYAELRKLEQLAHNPAPDSTTAQHARDVTKLLDERLLELRRELIADICDGRIEGEQVVTNILGLLNDIRHSLPVEERQAANRSTAETKPPRTAVPMRRAG